MSAAGTLFVSDGASLPKRMACFGSSATCVTVAFDLMHQAAGRIEFAGYVADNDPRAEQVDGFPIVGFDEAAAWKDTAVFVPIHDPTARRAVTERLSAAGVPLLGAAGLPYLVHPTARIGDGAIVQSSCRVGPGAVLGRGTVALGDLVAHDVYIGDFVTLAAGSTVLGHVKVGSNVWIGGGATIKNGTPSRPLTIGDGVVIGVGAVVDRDIRAGEVIVSPGALTLRERAAIKRSAKTERMDDR